MPATYDSLATTTLGSGAADITFSSISGSYTDLRLVVIGTSVSTGQALRMQFNGDTATNYSDTVLTGTGSSVTSLRTTGRTFVSCNYDSSFFSTTPSLVTVDIFSYAGSTNKTVLSSAAADNNGSGQVERIVSLWRSTSAITSIKLFMQSGNIASGTTATLYGILRA